MREREFKLQDILLPYQRQFVTSPKKKKLWVSSRQVGKSFTIAFEMCFKVLQRKNTLGLCISTGARAAAELLKKCKQMAEAIKIASKGAITYTDNAESITFSTGSRILSLPSNPDGIRGFTAAIVCIDECAFVPFVDECYQAIAPTLTRDPNAELIVCSTPAGCSGLFYDIYTQADDSWYIQTTTIEDAKAQGLNVDIDQLRELCSDPDIFEQEYMCKFSKEYGAFIDFDKVDFYNEIPKGDSGYYLGMDIGRKHDRTAITIVKAVDKKHYLENVIVLNKCQYSDQIAVVQDLHKKHQFTAGLIDEGGIGSAVAEQITKTVSSKLNGLQFTGTNKTRLYEAVRAKIFDHTLLFNPDFKQQLKQDFQNVHRIVTEAGQVKFEAGRDDNGHSDICSSLTLAIEAARTVPLNFELPKPHQNFSAFGSRQLLFSHY